MSPGSAYRCSADRSRRSRAGHGRARPTFYESNPARLGSPSRASGDPRLAANNSCIHNLCARHVTSRNSHNDRVEIPIGRAAALRPTSRGFLPWRLSDDGPGAVDRLVMGRHPKPFT
jgi:hypothetical protein